MARQVGDIKIEGTFDGLCFYKSEGEYFVRMKGGPTKKQVLHSPSFARTREHLSEFGACSQAGAFLRRQLRGVLPGSAGYAYRRMTKLMNQIKNYDLTSMRGERSVHEGLKQAAGKQLLYDFAFNLANPLSAVLLKKPVITHEHALLLDSQAIALPAGAAYALIGGALLNLDFEARTAERFVYDKGMVFANRENQGFRLSLKSGPDVKNMLAYFLTVRFYTQDGCSLQQGALDASGCIAVDPERGHEPKVPILKGEPLQLPLRRPNRKKMFICDEGIFAVRSCAPG